MIWTAERIAAAEACLKKWEGTPHRNRMATEGIGIDCIRLVTEVLFESGVMERMEIGYYNTDAGIHNPSLKLAAEIHDCLHVNIVSLQTPQFGDLAVFVTGKQSAHVGFCTGEYVWHSLANRGVTRNQYRLWRHEIEFLFRLHSTGWKTYPT